MCDKLISKNVKYFPKYVYKRMQKTPEGKYITPVMGQPIPFNRWTTAPKIPDDIKNYPCKFAGKFFEKIFTFKIKKNKKKPSWEPGYGNSSDYEPLHDGKWAAFEYLRDAQNVDLASNFCLSSNGYKRLKKVIVKCQIGGETHKSNWSDYPTYLFSAIKPIEEWRG